MQFKKFSVEVLFVIVIFTSIVSACRRESFWRKKRQTDEDERVVQRNQLVEMMEISGIQSGHIYMQPWMQKAAFCLNKNADELSSSMKEWYHKTHETCKQVCNKVYDEQATDDTDVKTCLNCFLNSKGLPQIASNINSTLEDINSCANKYLIPDLNAEMPKFTVENSDTAKVELPSSLKGRSKWFIVTVELPCKPKELELRNSMLVKTSTEGSVTSYVLTQNHLFADDNIYIRAKFNDDCLKNLSQAKIVWDKTIPGFALPQVKAKNILSKFSYTLQKDRLYFDTKSYEKMLNTSLSSFKLLERMNLVNLPTEHKNLSSLQSIGVEFSCSVKFLVLNQLWSRFRLEKSRNRFIITKIKENADFENIKFLTLLSSNCKQASYNIKTLINPNQSWLKD